MWIFRYEHNRDVCPDPYFATNGESLTGHGSMRSTDKCNQDVRPRFGGTGWPPYRIMEHERCAVTSRQFKYWIGNVNGLDVEGWDLIAYWVEDDKEDIDWRVDSDQIIFNPAFATNMGAVTLTDVYALTSESYIGVSDRSFSYL